MSNDRVTAAAYLGKSRRWRARARRAPLHPSTQGVRPTVVIGGTFGRNFSSLEGAYRRLQTGKAPGGTFRRDFSSFPCKTFAIRGRRTIAKGALGAQGEAWLSVSPCLRPCVAARVGLDLNDLTECKIMDHAQKGRKWL